MGFCTEELRSLNLDELKQQFERDGNYDDYYEEVAEQIVAQGEPGLVYLRKIVREAINNCRGGSWQKKSRFSFAMHEQTRTSGGS